MINIFVYKSGEKKHIKQDKPANLYDVLIAHQLLSDAPCGGTGRCGKCKIKVLNAPEPPSEAEKQFLSGEEIEGGIRLACETHTSQDIEIVLFENQSDAINLIKADKRENIKKLCAAFDIGTTTIESALIDCVSGDIISRAIIRNPQTAFGADVFLRMNFAMESDNNKRMLSESVVRVMNHMLDTMGDAVGVDIKTITGVAISGNTTMIHMLLKQDVKPLAAAPFITTFLAPEMISGKEIGLVCSKADVHLSPAASAFIGGDVISGAAALQLNTTKDTVLFIDLGTNGEMILVKDGVYVGCSVAAGPAFEGAEMSCGVRAVKGAVSDVSVDGDLVAQTIENKPPIGICGTGYIALITLLIENGLIDIGGRLTPASENQALNKRVDTTNAQPRFIVADNVSISQEDIRSFQLAKAAVKTGVEMLLEKQGITGSDIDTVYIAGGFGSNIKNEYLYRCDVLPFSHKHIEIAGNTALKGAVLSVMDSDFRNEVLDFSKQVDVFLLSKHPDFQNRFVDNLMF